ncbi:MAG: aldehyde ferredoxin oxidoreductase family protein [Candidatus Asgardarchaeia archaeon]
MLNGYAGKLLDINLSTEKVNTITLEEKIARQWFGGRGLGTYILWNELGDKWEEIDPLGEKNILLILNGPLSGYYPGTKVAVVSKSPESNGVVGSVISSEVGLELKAAGYDGIIIRGIASSPVYIFVHNDEVEIRDASKYWGLRGVELTRKLVMDVYKDLEKREKIKGLPKEPAIMYIGPGGENKVRFASIMAKWAHAAGYGGYGAVMGSKNLKAIVVKGTGPMPKVANPEKLKELIKQVYKNIFERTSFRVWGTGAGGYNFGNVTSSEPIRNWQEEWHDNAEISVINFENKVWIKRFWGDYGCPVTCMKISYITKGKYKGAVTDAPDYELMAYVGTNLGIFDPEKIVYLSWLMDEYGLDAINGGNILGFAAELYERGILTKNDLNGIDLKWGNADAFAKLIELIVKREGIGKILAEGTYRAALKISEMKNKDVLKFAVQVKGIAVGAHGVRSGLDYTNPISYAPSVQGGDHTSTAGVPAKGKGEYSIIFNDSAVTCAFLSWGVSEDLIEFTNTITGWNLTLDQWYDDIAARILHTQRLLLLLGGPDVFWDPRIHDDNPPRFYEPLPSGPQKGKTVTKEEFEKLKAQYYSEVGYDEFGIPKEEVVKKLEIPNAEKAIERIRDRLNL